MIAAPEWYFFCIFFLKLSCGGAAGGCPGNAAADLYEISSEKDVLIRFRPGLTVSSLTGLSFRVHGCRKAYPLYFICGVISVSRLAGSGQKRFVSLRNPRRGVKHFRGVSINLSSASNNSQTQYQVAQCDRTNVESTRMVTESSFVLPTCPHPSIPVSKHAARRCYLHSSQPIDHALPLQLFVRNSCLGQGDGGAKVSARTFSRAAVTHFLANRHFSQSGLSDSGH